MNFERRIRSKRSKGITYTWYILAGDKGATQFAVLSLRESGKLIALDLGFHSPEPIDGATQMRTCKELPEGKCYYDGSGLNALDVLARFQEHEDPEIIWQILETYYDETFN